MTQIRRGSQCIELFPLPGRQNVVHIQAGTAMAARQFVFGTGVQALEIRSGAVCVTLLPWKGVQVWDLTLAGESVKMASLFDEPPVSSDYLSSNGGFLVHCGFTAMGVPQPDDSHPLHGELPSAPFGKVVLEHGEDQGREWIEIRAEYSHRTAFWCAYDFGVVLRVRESCPLIDVHAQAVNRRHRPLDYMYMCHVNFRPEDNAILHDSFEGADSNIRVFPTSKSFPSEEQQRRYLSFVDRLLAEPSRHRIIRPEDVYEPEVVFCLPVEGKDGYHYATQLRTTGGVDLVRFRAAELTHAVRWISRNASEDAIGLCLPATAEHQGRNAETSKGNLKTLPPGESVRFHIIAGRVNEHHDLESFGLTSRSDDHRWPYWPPVPV